MVDNTPILGKLTSTKWDEHGRQFAREPNPEQDLAFDQVLTDFPGRDNVVVGRFEGDSDEAWLESTEVVNVTGWC